jgi:MoaA/NifB/PqqE/SkfB family radical SAM enzyme
MTDVDRVREVSVTNDLSFLWLEITGRCNLACSHCYAESSPGRDLYGSLTYGDWTGVIDEAAELGCRSVQFVGGEPTLHPRLHDLVDFANHRGFAFIEVFTNATRLRRDLVGCFRRCGVHVATSFYSDDPGTHERITAGEGSWQRTVRGIETALTAGLPVRVGVVETRHNMGHAPRAIEFLKHLGVRDIRIDHERGVGRGKPARADGDRERFEELCGHCWQGKLCIVSSGQAFPCVFSRATRLGDVRHGLSDIVHSATLTEFRGAVRAMHERQSRQPASNAQCNPDACGPGSCNPASGCNPDACGPGSCNPASGLLPDAGNEERLSLR